MEVGPDLLRWISGAQDGHVESSLHSVALNILFAQLDVRDVKFAEEDGVGVVQTTNTNLDITLCRGHDNSKVFEVGLSSLKIKSPGVLLLSLLRVPFRLEVFAHTEKYQPHIFRFGIVIH